MDTIRVGIVASGFTGQKHVDALRRIPGIEVVAIADPYASDLRSIAESLGIANIFTDYRTMLDRLLLDSVHNCTPNGEHFEISRYFLEKGIAVYSEKPLAVSIPQAEQLVTLAKEKKVVCGVNYNYRNNAAVQEMKARLETGDAGKCFLVHGTYLQDWLMYSSDYNWRLNDEQGGKSRATADIGSHWFDTIQVILGKKIIAVNAKLFTVHPIRKKFAQNLQTFAQAKANLPFENVPIYSEDAGFIMMQFEDTNFGMLVLSQVSGGYKNTFQLSIDCENYSMRWNQEQSDRLVIGTREHGETILYAASGAMTGRANEYISLPAGHSAGWNDALYNGINLFYQSIKESVVNSQRYATFSDGLYTMKIVESCLKSSREGVWIPVI